MKEEVLALIRELAAMLEPGATAVWAIVVRQQIITGIIDLLVALVMGIAAVCLIRAAYQIRAKENYDPIDDEPGLYVCWILGGIASIMTQAFLWPGLQRLMNPAYYAIMALRGML